MKKSKSIIILALIILLLGGAYFYVSSNPKIDKKDTSSTNVSTSSVEVWKIDNTKVSQVIIKDSGAGNTFVKKSKEWVIENYNHKIKQTTIDSITDSIINLSGTLVEKNANDMGKYGLDKPTINIVIVGKDLNKTLCVGDKTSDGTSYYVNEKGTQKVYFIAASIVDGLTLKQSAYRDNTITAIDATSLSYMKIVKAGSLPVVIIKNANQSKDEAKYNINTWMLTDAYNSPVNLEVEKISPVIAAIASLKAGDIADDNPKDLSKYGLDKPSLELTLKDSKSVLQLFIGKNKDGSSVYFKEGKGDTIYTMDKTVIDLFKFKPFDVITKFVYIVNLDYVNKIVVEGKGKTDTVLVSRTTAKAEKSGDPDVVTTNSKVNGKKIEINKFKTEYQEIIGLTVDAENDKKLEDKPVISITYSLNNGTKKQEIIDFVPYNDQFYAVFRNGKSDFVITKDKVNKMITSLESLK
ncbi:DUF4340 domain-containing protein [Clostridium estertheticum]|uniref:DUF4340 domain-containing protein n=1 Tax=Clostridium estertheticum TaxID=238834 RepID=UPI001C0DAE0A|nr:DUF4340 domain-containing protein [Clostridium estertheticum]MBU3199343.1 DUF4340 domain-containing protein [Clostridium estertheticum]WAG67412.1 DUF4340 domain-containing protein [Clostridium estertheticum]